MWDPHMPWDVGIPEGFESHIIVSTFINGISEVFLIGLIQDALYCFRNKVG